MDFWKSEEAEKRFAEVMHRALTKAPQFVLGPDPTDAVVVLDEAEYQRLRQGGRVRAAGEIRGFGGKELFEIMQNSPLAAALRDGDLPEDWLEQSRNRDRHCECCARQAQVDDAAD